MDDPETLRRELERLYGLVRSALEHGDFDSMRVILGLPEGMPRPSRDQMRSLLGILPALQGSRFLGVRQAADRAAYYFEPGPADPAQSTVTVLRFLRRGAGHSLAPAPHSFSTYQGPKVDDAKLRQWIDSVPQLRVVPPSDDAPTPSPSPEPSDRDDRPDEEIARELEAIWGRIRDAFARGAVAEALPFLDLRDGPALPTPEQATEAARELPDLSGSRFLALGWSKRKPHLVGYYAETNTGDPDESTVVLLVFARSDGKWLFPPHSSSIEEVHVPKAGREDLLRLIESDSRLHL